MLMYYVYMRQMIFFFNRFVPNGSFLQPLNTSENLTVFSGGREWINLFFVYTVSFLNKQTKETKGRNQFLIWYTFFQANRKTSTIYFCYQYVIQFMKPTWLAQILRKRRRHQLGEQFLHLDKFNSGLLQRRLCYL